jgi:transposase
VLQSSSLELSAQDAAVAYRQLEVVEDCFRHLKDALQLRPIHHRHPRRVMGHIGLCVLALFLLRLLEDRMMAAGICDPAGQIIQAVEQLQAVPSRFDQREVGPVPHVTTKTAAIFRALGVEDLRACFQRDLQTNHLGSPD